MFPMIGNPLGPGGNGFLRSREMRPRRSMKGIMKRRAMCNGSMVCITEISMACVYRLECLYKTATPNVFTEIVHRKFLVLCQILWGFLYRFLANPLYEKNAQLG